VLARKSLPLPDCSRSWLATHGRVLFVLCLVFVLGPHQPAAGQAQETLMANQAMAEGVKYYRKGSFGQAAVSWIEAARISEAQGSVNEQAKALTRLGRALQRMGQFRNAIVTLETALKLTRESGDQAITARILGRLGNVHFALGRGAKAIEFLEEGLVLARKENNSLLTAVLLNDLGNVFAAEGQTTQALGAYTESSILADAAGQEALAVTALINSAMTASRRARHGDAKERLDLAFNRVLQLEDTQDKAYGLLNIGQGYEDLRRHFGPTTKRFQGKRSAALGTRGVRVVAGREGSYFHPEEVGPTQPAEEKIATLQYFDFEEKLILQYFAVAEPIEAVEAEEPAPSGEIQAAKLSAVKEVPTLQYFAVAEPIEAEGAIPSGETRGHQEPQSFTDIFPRSDPPSEPPSDPSEFLPPQPTVPDEILVKRASESYRAALETATSTGDSRAESYAWGYLGHVSEDQGRYDQALTLTRRAALAARKVSAPESLYRWQWQTARLFKALGREDEALQAYRRAVSTLQPIRDELLIGYRGQGGTFQELVAPLYYGMADLLLKKAGRGDSPEGPQKSLIEARDTVEALKTAELEDYFHDECVAVAKQVTLEKVAANTAIIYPIILRDRLELLVNLPDGLRRYVVQVGAGELTQRVRNLRVKLENRQSRDYLRDAQQVYDWVVRPLEKDLRSLNIHTLVLVPDGELRSIPIAALHDGKEFLIQKFALAITPGMSLTDPKPFNRERVNVLAMGLSEGVQGWAPLPFVSTELGTLNELYGGTLLLNDEFVDSAVEEKMKAEVFTLVHIASHGLVAADATKSFILTYDGKIDMNRLAELIGLLRFRESPIELLTLSACETAAGDYRAALGLAGVAVKAGARSALATLWFIDDKASAVLVAEFYRELQNPDLTKAMALQRAQLKILTNPKQEHPSFWAPFLLINNWL